MTAIEQLRALLQVYGIDDTQYTDTQLGIIINQAKSLIGSDVANETVREDYHASWGGRVYCTSYYPILAESVTVTVDGETVTPHKITEDGLIYFDNHIQGEFSCTYKQGLSSDDIESTIIPMSMYMIRDIEGANKKSITEGDVRVDFDTTGSAATNSQISHLVSTLQGKYNKARVRLI